MKKTIRVCVKKKKCETKKIKFINCTSNYCLHAKIAILITITFNAKRRNLT